MCRHAGPFGQRRRLQQQCLAEEVDAVSVGKLRGSQIDSDRAWNAKVRKYQWMAREADICDCVPSVKGWWELYGRKQYAAIGIAKLLQS